MSTGAQQRPPAMFHPDDPAVNGDDTLIVLRLNV
jgi:hypothetical protein